jgi:hypothetical protein
MLDRFDLRTRQSRAVTVWPESLQGWAPAEVKYRFQWTFPICISPHDHNGVYVGSQFVHMTTNGGQSWEIISPDLSTNDKSKQQKTGGITADDASPLYACTLFAIAESPLENGQIWAGTNDGLLQMTRNRGKTWANVTKNIPNLPPWGTISNIEPSRHQAGTCYVTVDFHQVNDRDPYVFKTADYGKTWKSISSGIPKTPLSYAHCVREDPAREGLLYLGVENALYVSFDDGANWTPLQVNLPHAPVHWLVVQEHFKDLVVGTYGRGFWILDDITPLEQWTPEVAKQDVHFFKPRTAYRFQPVAGPSDAPNDHTTGKNPPYGASINYFLKEEPKEEIIITILDAEGKTVRTLKTEENADGEEGDEESGRGAEPFKVPKKPGINRIWWDLRYDKPAEVKLWTPTVDHEHANVEPKGWRAFPPGRNRRGPLAGPGIYTVKVKVTGREFSQELAVLKDPNTAGTADNVVAQTKLILEIHENTNVVAGMINQAERVRKQLRDLKTFLEGHPEAEVVSKAGAEIDKKLLDIEDFLFPVRLTGSGDELRWPDKFYVKLGSLASQAADGDYPPTDQMIEVHEMFKSQLAAQREKQRTVIEVDLAAFNKMLVEKKIPHILSVIKEK